MKLLLPGFFTLFTLLASLLYAEDVTITVDGSKNLGPVPEILNSSIWIQNLDNPGSAYVIDKFLNDNRPRTVQLSLPILKNTKSFADFKTSLQKYLKTPSAVSFVEKAKKYNTLVTVGFDPCQMPKWLSSRPGDNRPASFVGFTIQTCSPPRDYNLWANIVEYTLTYLKTTLGIKNLGFYIGHEQERDWLGDEKSFFKYYQYAAMAAKKVDESIKIGGIGCGHWHEKKCACDSYPPVSREICLKEGGWANPNNEPFMKNFIEYTARNNVPLDFLIWHSFGETPQKFPEIAETVRTWLRDYGFDDKKVKLYQSDWTYWEVKYPADYLDTQETAAYIPHSLYYMWKAGINWHGHDFDVIDYGGYGGGEDRIKKTRYGATFIGDWSLFTWGGGINGGIIKPMYNAFKAISMATHGNENETYNLLETKFAEEENIVAFSTITNNREKISLLVSNFIPTEPQQLDRHLLNTILIRNSFLKKEITYIKNCTKESTGRLKDREKAFLYCKEKLLSTLEDPKKKECINFIAETYKCLNNKKEGLDSIHNESKKVKYPETQKIANTIINLLNAQTKSIQAQVNFSNIPFAGKARLTTYRIDSNHGNACTYNKRSEHTKSSAACGIGGAVDQAIQEAKDTSKKEGIKAAKGYLLSTGYSDNEIQLIEKAVKNYNRKTRIREYVNNLLLKNSAQFSFPPEKVKKDLQSAFNRYLETYRRHYYQSIDTINNWEKISLEGTKKSEKIIISDNHYTLSIPMEPNAICLIVLEQERN
ncbi:MAG: hypothetical protein CV087_00140 [Candidatus Brocadia sp. WS118]|nr:MAG: hypothetical protein CV087_00140 [Candidatus Brocadia sp. WS118]